MQHLRQQRENQSDSRAGPRELAQRADWHVPQVSPWELCHAPPPAQLLESLLQYSKLIDFFDLNMHTQSRGSINLTIMIISMNQFRFSVTLPKVIGAV